MSKFWSGVENGAMVLFVFVIAYFFAMPNPGGGRSSSMMKKRSCISNMKTIEGALKLFYMENTYQDNVAISFKELISKKYLKSIPHCPAQGPNFEYMMHSTKALDGKVISEVECSLHGKLSLQDTADKNKGL
ncbi:MAG TPA: hypothetical protein PKK26_06465 [Candidatus Wallbacteria bacterium]|nr:hypothetical protein [Candidatus Wallbacteria bacterium]